MRFFKRQKELYGKPGTATNRGSWESKLPLLERPNRLVCLLLAAYIVFAPMKLRCVKAIESDKCEKPKTEEVLHLKNADAAFARQLLENKEPMSEKQVLKYLDENLYWVAVKDSSGAKNNGTAFHMGNGYFLTAMHVAEDAFYVPVVLVNCKESVRGTPKEYTFDVVLMNSQIDVALIRADSTFVPQKKQLQPAIYDGWVCSGDTLDFYMNGVHGNPIIEVDAPKTELKAVCDGDTLVWATAESKNGRYLRITGRAFNIGYGKESDFVYAEQDSTSCFKDNSTVLAYNGNSGSPMFLWKNGGYCLAGIICAARSSQSLVSLYEMEFQLVATEFGKPEYLRLLLEEYVAKKEGGKP